MNFAPWSGRAEAPLKWEPASGWGIPVGRVSWQCFERMIVSSFWMDVASALLSHREHLKLFWTLLDTQRVEHVIALVF